MFPPRSTLREVFSSRINSSCFGASRPRMSSHFQPEAVRLVYELVNRTPQARTEALGPLTPREDAVAVLLAQGMSNKKIAAELSVSVGTIRAHVDHILLKLGLHSRTQVAMWAIHRDVAAGQWSKPG